MKKILFTGPIGGVYGRDIEANLVAKVLENHFELIFFSTGELSKNPVCIQEIKNAKIASLKQKLLRNPILLIFSVISWFTNGFKNTIIKYSKNRINVKLIKKYKWDINILEKQIKDIDLVICFVQLSSGYLSDIIELCEKHDVKIIIRTTGLIKECPIKLDLIKKVNLFIHHSRKNKDNLLKFCKHNYMIIDQSTSLEKKLLSLETISKKTKYIFGYAGRLEKDKGIQEIIDVSEKFKIKLIIAGDGSLKKLIKNKSDENNNITYLGYLNYNNLNEFFNKIDVFFINSKTETGPLTGLEAMCSSRFIITRKVGAMPDRLFNNKNIWIEDKIENSLNDFFKLDKEEIFAIAKKNREIYLNKYCLNIIQNKYLLSINNLLNA